MNYTAEEVRERVARAICAGCEENPDHLGDARGNDYRWQDYLDVADAAIDAHLAGMGEPVAPSEAASVVDLHDRIEFALRDAGFGLDEASTLAERATTWPVMQDDCRIGFFERWREAAHEKGYAGVAEAITAAPTAFLRGTAPAFAKPAVCMVEEWVMVPREPTKAMLAAYEHVRSGADWQENVFRLTKKQLARHKAAYKTMLAVAADLVLETPS